MQYFKTGKDNDANKHNIGKSPNFNTLNNSRETVLHHLEYNKHRELLNYSGTPNNRFSPRESINGNYDCNYYIVYPVIGKTGDRIKIGAQLTTWDNHDVTGDCNFKWNNISSEKLAGANVIQSDNQTSSNSVEGSTIPNGGTYTDEVELDYNQGAFDGYGFVKFEFQHLEPASLVTWMQPIDESDYNALDPTYGTQSGGLVDSAFNIGLPLRGASAYDDSNGSVGSLCQKQLNDDSGGKNMVASSDLCLFQWGHPAGLLVTFGDTGLAGIDVFGYGIEIRGRELLSSDSGKFDMVLVYRADIDTEIAVIVGSTSTVHAQALTATTGTTPAVEVVLTDIPFDGSGDIINIKAVVDITRHVEIKSIAIFESTY